MNFIRTGLREIGLKIRRQKTRMALRHEKRLLQKSEISLGREGCSQAVNFPEVRNEIVALKKLEQEQREVAVRIAQLEEGVRQIELQRQENSKAQNAAVGELEEQKKPVLARRNEAKIVADRCDRELGGVDRRLEDNEAADRELARQLNELQTQIPPPEDLDARVAGFSGRRARLPQEREELSRARLGSAEACRQAKESLDQTQAELDAAEKKIAAVRAEFEARDRALNENSRSQQEAIREAREHHQTVEERKNPAYLNIGRHLASQGIAPPNAPHLLKDVHRHREAVERHVAHTSELAALSSQIDKQELRKFYFSIVSLLVLLAIILPLVFQTPPKREWLPQETDVILSLNTQQLDRAELVRRWRKEQGNNFARVWSGLLGSATQVPSLDATKDLLRVTRAMSTENPGTAREFTLVETPADLSQTTNALEHDHTWERRTMDGLPVWEKNRLSLSRVGPRTIAVGDAPEVTELVEVRLGQREDLKITGQFFDRFQALDQDSAVRLISRDPANLPQMFPPLFARELLNDCDLIGMSLTLQSPPKARLVLRAKDATKATDFAQRLHDEPQRWLNLQDSTLMLFAQPPEVTREAGNLELRFSVPENTARLILERLARVNTSSSPAPSN